MERGGGCLLALGLIGGTAAGVVAGQGTIGLLAGLALGIAAAALFNWRDRRRRGGDD